MKATKEELDRFHEFACEQVAQRDRDVSMYDLVADWMELREQERIDEVIRQGFEDIEAGRVTPASEFLKEVRQNKAAIRQGIQDIEAGRGCDVDEFMDAISHEFDDKEV